MTWLAGFERRELSAGGTYATTVGPKLLLHTTEGSTLAGAEGAFKPYPPHFGLSYEENLARQYVDLDRAAKSLKANDSERVVQVEIVGFADSSHKWAGQKLIWLGQQLGVIARAFGVPKVAAPQGFHGSGEGIVLASAGSPVRFSFAAFHTFSGWCGHQHAPSPDTHWDPGAVDIATLLAVAYQEDDMTQTELEQSLQKWLGAPPGDSAAYGLYPLLGKLLRGQLDDYRTLDSHTMAACLAALHTLPTGQVDVDALAAALNQSLPDAVVAALAAKLAG